MDGPLGERPRSCYYVYSKPAGAMMVGLFVCTLYTVMQNGTASERSQTLDFATDPYMKYVLENLPAGMSDEEKIQAIEGNYGTPYSQLHLWDVFGEIPKLTQLEAFITAKYPDIKAFETRKPKDGTAQWFAEGDAREKIYKFSLQLTVRPPGDPDEPPAPCPRRAAALLLPRVRCAPRFPFAACCAQKTMVDELLKRGTTVDGSHRYKEWLAALKAYYDAAGDKVDEADWVVDAGYIGRTIQLFKDRLYGHENKPQLTY
jgi:hypothetical protein